MLPQGLERCITGDEGVGGGGAFPVVVERRVIVLKMRAQGRAAAGRDAIEFRDRRGPECAVAAYLRCSEAFVPPQIE